MSLKPLIIYQRKICSMKSFGCFTFPRRCCRNRSVAFQVLGPSKAIKLQISLQWLTYSQSVSPVSAPILSQPIHSAYLCFPEVMGRHLQGPHTHTQTRADTLYVAQCLQSWLLDSAYLSVWRGQRTTTPTLTDSLSTSCNIENQYLLSALKIFTPGLATVCVCLSRRLQSQPDYTVAFCGLGGHIKEERKGDRPEREITLKTERQSI